ncbi:MAG TPA: DUF1416 domain-containing protein [Streptosporangiaceae bacterium]|nr:DUF1416 domain-containing protein [Streptosporangiaceae bacterium]
MSAGAGSTQAAGTQAAGTQAVAAGCGAPAGGAAITDAGNQAVVQGQVTKDGSPVGTGYARLLNGDGEFVAEVPLGEDGGFRFFAAPGTWTLRILAPGGVRAQQAVSAATGKIVNLEVAV